MSELRCVVCDVRTVIGVDFLCTTCGRSYDREASSDGGTIQDVIKWAALRARSFERKRKTKR